MLCTLPSQHPVLAFGVVTPLKGSLSSFWEKAHQRSWDRAKSLGDHGVPCHIPHPAAHHFPVRPLVSATFT